MMELSLDLRLDNYYSYVPQMVKEDGSQALDVYLKRLEEERRKIQVFKRELPLSMLLLDHTILRLREKVKSKEGDDDCDKKDWMSSFQLWSVVDDNKSHTNSGGQKGSKEEDNDRSTCENPIQVLKHGGAFVPYKAVNSLERGERKQEGEIASVAEMGSSYLASRSNCTAGFQMMSGAKRQRQQQQQASKRQRRCWSSQLHRSFVDAVEQLGGSHVATPKQIKELMQVDGLTNDEVKSHLQKYRIHILKDPSSSAATLNHGLWMNCDKSKDHSEATVSQSSSPPESLDPSGIAERASNAVDSNIQDEDDGKSESLSWNGRPQRSAEVDM